MLIIGCLSLTEHKVLFELWNIQRLRRLMVHVKVDCKNILTQKRKTRVISHSNPSFRVCHICHFNLQLLYVPQQSTLIYIRWCVGWGLGWWKLFTSKREGEVNPKVLKNFHIVFAATELHSVNLFFQLFLVFKQSQQQRKTKNFKIIANK